MAVAALTGAYIGIAAAGSGGTAPGGSTAAANGFTLTSATDISNWVTAISTEMDVADVDATTFGSGGYTTAVAGLKSGMVTLSINQDFAASAPNALLGINGSVCTPGNKFYIEIKPSSSSRSATNPSFVCYVLHKGLTTFAAKVGDIPTLGLKVRVIGGFGELTS